jgi:hypothetical protein
MIKEQTISIKNTKKRIMRLSAPMKKKLTMENGLLRKE